MFEFIHINSSIKFCKANSFVYFNMRIFQDKNWCQKYFLDKQIWQRLILFRKSSLRKLNSALYSVCFVNISTMRSKPLLRSRSNDPWRAAFLAHRCWSIEIDCFSVILNMLRKGAYERRYQAASTTAPTGPVCFNKFLLFFRF